jgi:DNA-binding NtrC family response regulator
MTETGSRALRVLVADDDAGLARVVRLVLEQRGHSVHVAGSAAHARALAASHPIDVALVDARMPGDGVQLRRDLEAGGLGGRTILITGDPTSRRAEATGAPLLGKPFDYERLVDLVESLGQAAP